MRLVLLCTLPFYPLQGMISPFYFSFPIPPFALFLGSQQFWQGAWKIHSRVEERLSGRPSHATSSGWIVIIVNSLIVGF